MKSFILWLPGLMVFGFTATLAAQTPRVTSTESRGNRDAEILQLRQETKSISNRLEQLDEGHPINPRGGLSFITELHVNPIGTIAAKKPHEVAATVLL